jgi:hypothetical protein
MTKDADYGLLKSAKIDGEQTNGAATAQMNRRVENVIFTESLVISTI